MARTVTARSALTPSMASSPKLAPGDMRANCRPSRSATTIPPRRTNMLGSFSLCPSQVIICPGM